MQETSVNVLLRKPNLEKIDREDTVAQKKLFI